MKHAIWLIPALTLLAACEEEGGERLVELDDQGTACLGSFEGGDATLEADASATIYVTFESCAAGCASDIQTACTATVNGSTVEVTGTASYAVPTGDVDCAAVCQFVQASCDTSALPEDAYTLTYAGEQLAFDVPTTGNGLCTSEIR